MDIARIKEQKEQLGQLKMEMAENMAQSFNELAQEFIPVSDKLVECLDLLAKHILNKEELIGLKQDFDYFLPEINFVNRLEFANRKEEELTPEIKLLRDKISENWNSVLEKLRDLAPYLLTGRR